ncbi:hypothetical protein E3N88_26697 [Mikania micrantha]|uniref:Uncharacterized protein n=1 Tax=Mikania micrantha TaxID=192012 RepID=A0A5N6MVD6_9ASTR|nr:hypothetical protein E3N88_26697 [Mikania micrantha]
MEWRNQLEIKVHLKILDLYPYLIVMLLYKCYIPCIGESNRYGHWDWALVGLIKVRIWGKGWFWVGPFILLLLLSVVIVMNKNSLILNTWVFGLLGWGFYCCHNLGHHDLLHGQVQRRRDWDYKFKNWDKDPGGGLSISGVSAIHWVLPKLIILGGSWYDPRGDCWVKIQGRVQGFVWARTVNTVSGTQQLKWVVCYHYLWIIMEEQEPPELTFCSQSCRWWTKDAVYNSGLGQVLYSMVWTYPSLLYALAVEDIHLWKIITYGVDSLGQQGNGKKLGHWYWVGIRGTITSAGVLKQEVQGVMQNRVSTGFGIQGVNYFSIRNVDWKGADWDWYDGLVWQNHYQLGWDWCIKWYLALWGMADFSNNCSWHGSVSNTSKVGLLCDAVKGRVQQKFVFTHDCRAGPIIYSSLYGDQNGGAFDVNRIKEV